MTTAAETHLDLEDLPPLVKSNLCEIIEQKKGQYEELGRLMQFNEFDIAVSHSSLLKMTALSVNHLF